MQIAAVQSDIDWEDRAANHAHVRRLVLRADVQENALVVLPEMFDVGFSTNVAKTNPGARSESENFVRSLAMQKKAAVVAGVVAARDGQLANEAIVFAPDGRELTRYRKMRPFSGAGEELHYPAGNEQRTTQWNGVRITPLICYDLRFPELFRPSARATDLFVVIANWPRKRSEHWVRLLQARAIENQAFVLGVNRTGTDPNQVYDGRSALFDPQGREIFQADNKEQVLVADIDPEAVRQWREEFPALKDMR